MPTVLAVAAHPDDIEFVMAGTLLLLKDQGWEVHYFNLANGCYGSTQLDPKQTASVRLEEAKQAAALIPAAFHPPICDDFGVLYNDQMLRRVLAVVRQASPTIVLTHAPEDYMEDHQNACRLAVTAAFSKAVRHLVSDPPQPPAAGPVAVYHAQPHGNRLPLGQKILPDWYVDIGSVMERKQRLLGCHRSQSEWLEQSQGMQNYVQTMIDLGSELGSWSGRFGTAEGWRQRLHLGFSGADFDPLGSALKPFVMRRQGLDI